MTLELSLLSGKSQGTSPNNGILKGKWSWFLIDFYQAQHLLRKPCSTEEEMELLVKEHVTVK